MDVTHGTPSFKNRWRTLRVSRDERHALLKTNIAPLLELSRKFWETREKKESGITQFKRRQSTRQFHPKEFIQVCSTQPNTNTVLLYVKSETGTLYQKERKLSKWLPCAIFKTADPKLHYYYFIINFTYLMLPPWLYFNISEHLHICCDVVHLCI